MSAMAESDWGSAGVQAGDLHIGEGLPVASSASVAFAALEFLNDDLFGSIGLKDLARDGRPFQVRGSDLGFTVAGDQEDPVEDDLSARIAIAPVDPDYVAFLNAELVRAVFENRVHGQ